MALRSTQPQKWVPGVFPGGKGSRCTWLTTLPPSRAVVMKSGNLNFLEPSGTLQACNRTALTLPYIHEFHIYKSVPDHISSKCCGFIALMVQSSHDILLTLFNEVAWSVKLYANKTRQIYLGHWFPWWWPYKAKTCCCNNNLVMSYDVLQ